MPAVIHHGGCIFQWSESTGVMCKENSQLSFTYTYVHMCVRKSRDIKPFLLSFFSFLSHFNVTFQFLSATQSCLVLLCPQLVEKCYNILKQYSLCFVHQPRYFCITHEAKKKHGIKTVCILTVNSQVFFSEKL